MVLRCYELQNALKTNGFGIILGCGRWGGDFCVVVVFLCSNAILLGSAELHDGPNHLKNNAKSRF